MSQANQPELQIVIFPAPGGEVSFAVNGDRDTLWGTREEIATVFECTEENVRQHIRNLYKEGELDEPATSKKFLEVQIEGGRSVKRQVERFNLDVILSVGYRVSSRKAALFRRWAIHTLKQFITTGYLLDEKRLTEDAGAQRELFQKLRAIRHDEKAMYAKVRDVFKVSASDYNAQSQAAKTFFAMAQDKFHYAITGKTAAEIILDRADSRSPNMGLQTIKGDAPTQAEIHTAKNYLLEREMEGLENICEQFLLFAESKAFRGHKMSMEEIATKLNILLTANDYPVLYDYKSYLKQRADDHARHELETYRARIAAPKDPPRALQAATKKPTAKAKRRHTVDN